MEAGGKCPGRRARSAGQLTPKLDSGAPPRRAGMGWLEGGGPRWWGLMLCILALAYSEEALAQHWVPDAVLGVATGLEIGDMEGQVGSQRARTRLVAGVDLGVDDAAYSTYGLRAFVELERSLGVGFDLGYNYAPLPQLLLFAGGTAVIAPKSLYGGTLRGTYVWAISPPFSLGFWLSVSAMPFGEDRSSEGALVWTLIGIEGRLRMVSE